MYIHQLENKNECQIKNLTKMEKIIENLKLIKDTMKDVRMYCHAANLLEFDQQTICPSKAMEQQGEIYAFLLNKAFVLQKDPAFVQAVIHLYDHRTEIEDKLDCVMVESLYLDHLRGKNITSEIQHEHSLVYNRAFVNWLSAKNASDFSLFATSLDEVREAQLKEESLNEARKATPYDTMLDYHECGITCSDLDETFEECKERLIPLLQKIKASKKKIRTDFLGRTVPEEAQRKMSEFLLKTMGFDFERGAYSTAEHPFTSGLGKFDARVTTHYYPNAFYSSMFSIIHEGGHALFEQNQPAEDFEHFIEFNKTMGMHESVSRFYENRIGRSREFISLIYPKCKELFPEVFHDVSEREFYEAMNIVQPSFIRTEADEFTYTFHIIIRYEMEKLMINGDDSGNMVATTDLPKIWNDKYEKYLGICPTNDRDGILQDIHWTTGFGYFPAYAIGNMYNAMYFNRMKSEFDLSSAIKSGDFNTINQWMKNHVWAHADQEDPKTWIKNITGREFTPHDFLDYLEEKYGEIYDL